ncbi:DUF975 family protein [uncultured Catenibacterium sp.]|uniref:DUF975 family protein n=1 Tax=uncultured Catenibacterium sp. TaxID=286142 RepID=UPI0025CE8EE7|nr:DUF975 family protein [uncultured Catenibacterium sp.]
MNISMIKQRAREIARVNKTSLSRICLIIGVISAFPSLLNSGNGMMHIIYLIISALLLAVEQGHVVAGLKVVTDREYELSDNDGVYGVVNWLEYLPTYLTKVLVIFVISIIFIVLILACSFGSFGGLFALISDPYRVSPIAGFVSGLSALSGILLFVLFFAFLFIIIWVELRMFAMTYLHQEYGIKGFAALKESFALMKGHCADLFLINLTFVGWIILCAFISGMIGGVFGDNGIAGLLGSILSAALGAYTYQPAYITVHALFYKEIAYKFYDEGRI